MTDHEGLAPPSFFLGGGLLKRLAMPRKAPRRSSKSSGLKGRSRRRSPVAPRVLHGSEASTLVYRQQLELTMDVLRRVGPTDWVRISNPHLTGYLTWEQYEAEVVGRSSRGVDVLLCKIRATVDPTTMRTRASDVGTNSLTSDVDVTVSVHNRSDAEALRRALDSKYADMVRLDVNFYPDIVGRPPVEYDAHDATRLLLMKAMSLDPTLHDSRLVERLPSKWRRALQLKARHEEDRGGTHSELYAAIFQLLRSDLQRPSKETFLAWKFLLPDGYALPLTFAALTGGRVDSTHSTMAFLENAICLRYHDRLVQKPKYIKRMLMAMKTSDLLDKVGDMLSQQEMLDLWIALAESYHTLSRHKGRDFAKGSTDHANLTSFVERFCVLFMEPLVAPRNEPCDIGSIAYQVLLLSHETRPSLRVLVRTFVDALRRRAGMNTL